MFLFSLTLWTENRNAALVREVQEAIGFIFPWPALPLVSLGALTEFLAFLAENEGQKERSPQAGAQVPPYLVRDSVVCLVGRAHLITETQHFSSLQRKVI